MDIKRVHNLMVEKLNKLKATNTGMDNDILRERIKNQDWPNIYIKEAGDQDKGKGVFSSIHMIRKGTIVCDYHGNQVRKSEGERRLKDNDFPESNYSLFFKAREGPDGQRCIDGCKKCQCHTEEEFQQMKGRMINHHSGPLANLSLHVRGARWESTSARYDIPLVRSSDSTMAFGKTKQEINFHGLKKEE